MTYREILDAASRYAVDLYKRSRKSSSEDWQAEVCIHTGVYFDMLARRMGECNSFCLHIDKYYKLFDILNSWVKHSNFKDGGRRIVIDGHALKNECKYLRYFA